MEPLITRAAIAAEAAAAAKRLNAGEAVSNPYPDGSDAHAAWQATVSRYLCALREEELAGESGGHCA